jgi:hypothetical protein
MVLDLKTPAQTFMQDVDNLVLHNGLTYIEAIVHWAELKGLDLDYVAGLAASNLVLKSRLQSEAEDLNFIPRSTRLVI